MTRLAKILAGFSAEVDAGRAAAGPCDHTDAWVPEAILFGGSLPEAKVDVVCMTCNWQGRVPISAVQTRPDRVDGSVPDPAPHACARCGNTNGCQLVRCVTTQLWWCDDVNGCFDRAHGGGAK